MLLPGCANDRDKAAACVHALAAWVRALKPHEVLDEERQLADSFCTQAEDILFEADVTASAKRAFIAGAPLSRALEHHSTTDCRLAGYPITDFLENCGGVTGVLNAGFSLEECIKARVISSLACACSAGYSLRACLDAGLLSPQGGIIDQPHEDEVCPDDDGSTHRDDETENPEYAEEHKCEAEPSKKKKKRSVLRSIAKAVIRTVVPISKGKTQSKQEQEDKTNSQDAPSRPPTLPPTRLPTRQSARPMPQPGQWVAAAVLAKLAGFELPEIRAEGLVTSAREAREFRFSATEVKQANFGLIECLRGGFSELKDAMTALRSGFSAAECREAGLIKTAHEASDAGLDIGQAKRAGFSLYELWEAGFVRSALDFAAAEVTDDEIAFFLQQLAKEISDKIAKEKVIGNPAGLHEIVHRLDFLKAVDKHTYMSCLEVVETAIQTELKKANIGALVKDRKFKDAVKLHKTVQSARSLLQKHIVIPDSTSQHIRKGFAALVEESKAEIRDDDVAKSLASKSLGLQALSSLHTVKDSLLGDFESDVKSTMKVLYQWTIDSIWQGLIDDLGVRSIAASDTGSRAYALATDIVTSRQRRGHYAVLGVEPNSDSKMLTKARNELARNLHPDKASSEDVRKIMEEAMKLVNNAYETLKDPETRQEYDRNLKNNADNRSSHSQGILMQSKRVAFKLIKQYRVALYLNLGKLFADYFSKQFSVGTVSTEVLRVIGNHIRFFTAVDGEIGNAAQAVQDKIAGFDMHKAADYNRKAGGVTVEDALTAFRVHKSGRVFQARTGTLEQAFLGYAEKHDILLNDLLRQARAAASRQDGSADWLDATMNTQAKALAAKLDPRRLYKDARLVGELMAVVAVQWTKAMLRKIRGIRPEDVKRESLWMPHNTQLLGTFAMLGLGANEDLKNQLIRCGTGEGKSVCLGLTATLFALLGLDVYVVSYNARLSTRDYNLFSPLFINLDVAERVRYDTIKGLVDSMLLTDALPNFRDLVEDYLRGRRNTRRSSHFSKNSVLLVDEVDVLLGDGYYGKTFCPGLDLDADELFIYMWDHRERFQRAHDDNQIMRELRQSVECSKFLRVYPGLSEELLNVILWRMLQDVKLFVGKQPPASYSYIVDRKDKRIGHNAANEGDTSWSTKYGPRTTFARLLEFGPDCGNLKFCLTCGQVLYNELPLKFPIVLGLTATLPSDSYSSLLTGYNLVYQSHLPSTFKKIAMTIHKPHLATSEKEFFEQIASEVQACEAVLVILEDKAMVEQCRDYLINSGTLAGVAVLHEEDNDLRNEGIASAIALASFSGTVTLATAAFARGTDFPACDQSVANHGGVLVLDTVPWLSRSDEEQAMGRTGRQDDPGQYKQLWLFVRVEEIWGKDTAHKLLEASQDVSDAAANWADIVYGVRQQQERAKCDKMRSETDRLRPHHERSLHLPHDLAKNDVSLLVEYNS